MPGFKPSHEVKAMLDDADVFLLPSVTGADGDMEAVSYTHLDVYKRQKLGEELNEDIAWRIGRAYGEFLKPKTIVLGGDVRLTLSLIHI